MTSKSQQISDNEALLTPTNTLERSLAGGRWFLIDSLLQKLIIFGAFFITARLLSPHDFGLIALAAIYPNLIDSLTAFGFETALSQKRLGEEKPYLNAVWSFTLLRSFAVFLIVFFSANFVSNFLKASDAVLLFKLSAIPLLFQAFSNVGQIYFFRHLEIKKVFIRDMANYGTAAFITVIGAWLFRSYWAIFIGNSVGILMGTITTYILTDYRPRIDLMFSKMKTLLFYSEWVFGQNIVTRLAQTIEDLLVGHFTNATSVGFYTKAKSLTNAPLSPLGNIIGKIGFSAMVAVQDSPSHIREGFNKSFDLVCFIAIPFIVAIWIGGERLIHIILGPAWTGITPLLGILVVAAGLNSGVINVGAMLMNVLNKPQFVFYMNLLSLICAIIFFPIFILSREIYGAAIAVLLSSILVALYTLFLLNKTIKLDWKRMGQSAVVSAIASSSPLLLAPFLFQYHFSNTTLGFLMLGLLFSTLYLAIIIVGGKVFNVGPYKTVSLILTSFRKN